MIQPKTREILIRSEGRREEDHKGKGVGRQAVKSLDLQATMAPPGRSQGCGVSPNNTISSKTSWRSFTFRSLFLPQVVKPLS